MTRTRDERRTSVNVPLRIRPHARLARRLPAAWALIGVSALGLTGCVSAAPARQPPSATATSSTQISPPVAVDPAYENAVESRIADSLRLTVAQVRSQLRAAPGSGLENVAKPLGLAQDQLARIVLSGLDGAADSTGRSGRWTARQAQAEKMYWASQSFASLDTGVTSWFVNG
jgi:hypothetical protein